MDLIPSNIELSAVEISLVNTMSRELVLRSYIDSIKHKYDSYVGDPVCEYFLKKRAEGKHYRVAMFAAYNEFLRIYHSRVSSVLNEVDSLA